MIDCTKLLCGTIRPADALRYGRRSTNGSVETLRYALEKKPIVVWNMTPACNLYCIHCYYSAGPSSSADELSTAEAKTMIDDLAQFGAPVLLFSGGEPLMRPDLMELGAYAVARGTRTVISTNGTLIDQETAQRIKEENFSYVGVSLDGIGETNDKFRGDSGAFDAALAGIRHCKAAGVKVGLRLTLNRHTVRDLSAIMDLLEEEQIPRACFYHLVYAGRGRRIQSDDLSLEETRVTIDYIMDRVEEFHRKGIGLDILTVDNHADGPFLYQRVKERQPERADEVLQLLQWNGGNSSGVGIAAIDHAGNVHADQFWQHYSFGNVRERPFSAIWLDTNDELMAGLKDRKPRLNGRCAECHYLDICNGNFRVRAEAVTGDVWASDPACYLTDEEIGAKNSQTA